MSTPRTCDLCGTVNVTAAALCIACGQDLPPMEDMGVGVSAVSHPPADEEGASVGREQATEHGVMLEDLQDHDDDIDERLRAAKAAARLKAAEEAEAVIPRPPPPDPDEDDEEETRAADASAPDRVRYLVRVLRPEGDRSGHEVGSRPVRVGSGLDELGLTGDPRCDEGEASLSVRGGRLYIEPAPDAQSIYRRLRTQEQLADCDVVLMGDVAARFETLGPVPAVDGTRHVLGGSAPAACGRLILLRRDGSDGPVHDLGAGKTVLGRTDGHLNFPHDSRLSRRHVRFFASEQGVTVEDLGSRNGTYVLVRDRRELTMGDALRIGSAGIQVRDRISGD